MKKYIFTFFAFAALFTSCVSQSYVNRRIQEAKDSTKTDYTASINTAKQELRKDIHDSVADAKKDFRNIINNLKSLPIGTIVSYGGDQIPEGWTLCNGDAKSVTGEFAELFKAIGSNWGSQTGASFNLPDLRGYFLRGVDPSGTTDPEFASRTRKKGALATSKTGTYQEDMFREHKHLFVGQSSESENGQGFVTSGGSTGSNQPLNGTGISKEGGLETRPKNAAVHFIIKYK